MGSGTTKGAKLNCFSQLWEINEMDYRASLVSFNKSFERHSTPIVRQPHTLKSNDQTIDERGNKTGALPLPLIQFQ